ncbi:MAG: hypothetical protein VZT48_05945 [Bulleidia sp.]|nr:hypothetical protein [Bulleidia sp.]
MSELSDHELLVQLVLERKKTRRTVRFILIGVIVIAAVLFVSAVIIVPKAASLLISTEDTVKNINALVNEAEPAVNGISRIDYDSLNRSVTELEGSVTALNNALKIFR